MTCWITHCIWLQSWAFDSPPCLLNVMIHRTPSIFEVLWWWLYVPSAEASVVWLIQVHPFRRFSVLPQFLPPPSLQQKHGFHGEEVISKWLSFFQAWKRFKISGKIILQRPPFLSFPFPPQTSLPFFLFQSMQYFYKNWTASKPEYHDLRLSDSTGWCLSCVLCCFGPCSFLFFLKSWDHSF